MLLLANLKMSKRDFCQTKQYYTKFAQVLKDEKSTNTNEPGSIAMGIYGRTGQGHIA